MEDFSADRTRASAGTRFPPPPHGFVHYLTPSASRSTFRHQTASHRIDVFLSVMTRGSDSPLPQSADSVQRPMLVIGGCDPGRIALSPLYKCMGVEHLCGCQVLHSHSSSWSWQLWLRSPRWQPCPQFCYQGRAAPNKANGTRTGRQVCHSQPRPARTLSS